jgi:hypothetical protein
MSITFIVIVIVIYFLPAIVAATRRGHAGPVVVVNLFLGWVVSLAMACGKSEERPSRPVVSRCHLCGLPLDPRPHVCGIQQPAALTGEQTPAPMTWREAIGFPKKGWLGEDPEWIERNQIERP